LLFKAVEMILKKIAEKHVKDVKAVLKTPLNFRTKVC
jgi:hypothetical protein